MTPIEIRRMLALKPSYNHDEKEEFRRLSRKFMNAVVKELGLAKGQYDIHFNAGGIAVSGDTVLHTENFYVMINLGGCQWVLARTCKGRKDFLGGPNKAYDFGRLHETASIEAFATWLRATVLPQPIPVVI